MKLLNWFIYSSKNPEKIALTIKGLLPLLVLVGLGNVANEEIVDAGLGIFMQIATLISSVVSFYGLVRKIWRTI